MHIGVYDEEFDRSQSVVFTVDVWVPQDLESDNYWDYTTVIKAIQSIVASGHIGLQEEVHDSLFKMLFSDQRVRAVRILTKKIEAVHGAAAASVTSMRLNPDFSNQ